MLAVAFEKGCNTFYFDISYMKIPFTPHPCSNKYYSLFNSCSNKTSVKQEVKGNYLNIVKIIYWKSIAIIILSGNSLNSFIQNQELHIELLIKYISQVSFMLNFKTDVYYTYKNVQIISAQINELLQNRGIPWWSSV